MALMSWRVESSKTRSRSRVLWSNVKCLVRKKLQECPKFRNSDALDHRRAPAGLCSGSAGSPPYTRCRPSECPCTSYVSIVAVYLYAVGYCIGWGCPARRGSLRARSRRTTSAPPHVLRVRRDRPQWPNCVSPPRAWR
ncbi:hypothetical protein C8Q80DRAFT_1149223 [Daedaleopsis nitida]|nr:hypothetical protein C8Q80DRAFT_1149223 [Daedaleopsis nitida]